MADSTQTIARANDGQQQQTPSQREQRQAGTLARRDPFEMLDELQDEMTRFWTRAFGGMWPVSPFRRLAQAAPGSWPRLDVVEQDNDLVIKVDLPGTRKEDVQVELDEDSLVIRGERRAETEAREENTYRLERRLGTFYRRIPLPFRTNPDQIQATMNDGVLEIRIPRPAEQRSEARRVQVK